MDKIDWDALQAVAEKDNDVKNFVVGSNNPIEIEVINKDKANDAYAVRKRLLAYYKYFTRLNYKSEEVKDVFKSLVDCLTVDFNHLYSSFKDDLKELDVCYSSRAYKATLILAGSILEAFLLDWLSEIHGKNYFEEPFMVDIPQADGTFKREKREKLNVYIEQIKEIEKPDWMESSIKAKFIQKNRNSVHAKVCLKKELDIDAETCKKVITYLKDIIDTRLEKRRKELGLG